MDRPVRAVVVLAVIFIGVCSVWLLSIFGYLPITYDNIATPAGVAAFLDSPRDDMRGLKVNGHMLEIGKRPALQIIKDYDEHLYQLRPYRKALIKPRNMTRYEVMDFCINVTGQEYGEMREALSDGKTLPAVWEGPAVRMIRVSLFSYLVDGLSEKPVFIAQTELAKRLGIEDEVILARIVPAQKRWYAALMNRKNIVDSPFPAEFRPALRDELVELLGEMAVD